MFYGSRHIPVGPEVAQAFAAGIENYVPIFQSRLLLEEGGITEVSTENLNILLKCGLIVKRVLISPVGALIEFEDEVKYLATGFCVGTFSVGSYYLAVFGEKAGFGKTDELYPQITDMDKTFVGELWTK